MRTGPSLPSTTRVRSPCCGNGQVPTRCPSRYTLTLAGSFPRDTAHPQASTKAITSSQSLPRPRKDSERVHPPAIPFEDERPGRNVKHPLQT